jgi:hypothetical protein
MYGIENWKKATELFLSWGLTPEETEEVLRSKWMRWVNDWANAGYGEPKDWDKLLNAFTKSKDKILRDAKEMTSEKGRTYNTRAKLSWNLAPSEVNDLRGWLVYTEYKEDYLVFSDKPYCIVSNDTKYEEELFGWWGKDEATCLKEYEKGKDAISYEQTYKIDILPIKKVF